MIKQDVVRKTTKSALSINKASSTLMKQQIKIPQRQDEILAQNKKLESIVREQAKAYSWVIKWDSYRNTYKLVWSDYLR